MQVQLNRFSLTVISFYFYPEKKKKKKKSSLSCSHIFVGCFCVFNNDLYYCLSYVFLWKRRMGVISSQTQTVLYLKMFPLWLLTVTKEGLGGYVWFSKCRQPNFVFVKRKAMLSKWLIVHKCRVCKCSRRIKLGHFTAYTILTNLLYNN